MAINELRLAHKASNGDHLIKFIDAFFDEGKIVIAMEFADGGSMDDVIQRGTPGSSTPGLPEPMVGIMMLQAFEGLLLNWEPLSVRLEASDVPQLPVILRKLAANSTALREKRLAIASEWTRLIWREAMPPDIAKLLRGAPDAFDSLMQSLWLRMRYGLRGDGAGWRPKPTPPPP